MTTMNEIMASDTNNTPAAISATTIAMIIELLLLPAGDTRPVVDYHSISGKYIIS